MRIIHCTKKLLKELDVPLLEPDKIASHTGGIGNWYANLLRIDRRKCVIFTNEKTLYTFLIPKVLKANLKNIEEEFLISLSYNLQNEGFGINVINGIMQEYQTIVFAKTMNKSVLGSMNDPVYQYEAQILRAGGIGNIKILQINHIINRTPMSALKYKYPIEALRNVFEESA
jgi:hypothetical protein